MWPETYLCCEAISSDLYGQRRHPRGGNRESTGQLTISRCSVKLASGGCRALGEWVPLGHRSKVIPVKRRHVNDSPGVIGALCRIAMCSPGCFFVRQSFTFPLHFHRRE